MRIASIWLLQYAWSKATFPLGFGTVVPIWSRVIFFRQSSIFTSYDQPVGRWIDGNQRTRSVENSCNFYKAVSDAVPDAETDWWRGTFWPGSVSASKDPSLFAEGSNQRCPLLASVSISTPESAHTVLRKLPFAATTPNPDWASALNEYWVLKGLLSLDQPGWVPKKTNIS